ncbi:MAG TPA: preprotein translocase subunit SecA [Anaerolineae bacterium]|nr:preprotein translocase subunit SecA [Anaerolineae bacterium]
MLKNLFTKVVGDPNDRELARLHPLVDQINALEPELERLSDGDLRAITDEFRARVAEATGELQAQLDTARAEAQAEEDLDARRRLDLNVKKLDDELFKIEQGLLDGFLPRAFAAVREAAKRTITQRHFDVQLIGGIVLNQNRIAEMKTGEGKTLVATLPLYLNALAGHGAHLVTPNDYLSKLGAQWMGPIYHALGLTVGVIQHESAFRFDPDFKTEDDRYDKLRPVPRREAYTADVTYGTNNEFGFDYLRDNMVWSLSQTVQRPLYYAIVDEVDNILVDEARTPLIISGPAEESSDNYRKFAELVRRLRPSTNGDNKDEEPDGDYVVEEKTRNATLAESGVEKVERALSLDNLYSPENSALLPYLDNALRAHAVYKRDKDYIVKDGEVIIVDEFTGRLMYGRRYSEGLHQAIEAKENVTVQRESLTYATITFQNYFRMYRKLAGMTGTAKTEEEEFQKIYNLDVVVIPTHRPMIRDDYADVIYKTEAAKFKAVVDEIDELHEMGRPVLVGTVAIETSERLSGTLRRRGIPHNVLNAKEHEKEAGVIAQAGRAGTVTVATNMAGRGVDILLGGNPEGLARETLRRQGKDLTQITKEERRAALEEAERKCAEEKKKVIELGGLHILGTERHEARRIDNQLRGRAGRQGDPGSSRFYISLEDDLMRRFGGDRIKGIMDWAKMEEDVPLEHGLLSKTIEQAQTRVEGYNFDVRKHVLEYDDVINKQREVIYAQRRKILTEKNLRPIIFDMIADEIGAMTRQHTQAKYADEWDLGGLMSAARGLIPLPATLTIQDWKGLGADEIEDQLLEYAEKAYDEKARQLGEIMPEAERITLLRAVDLHWVRHLTDLDILREGIGLRAYGQQNPLIAYKKEAFETFDEMNESIRSQVARDIFRVQASSPSARPDQAAAPAARATRANLTGGAKGQRPVRKVAVETVGRNAPCPCGSGKKYKHCHGRPGAEPLPAGVGAKARPGAVQGRPAK